MSSASSAVTYTSVYTIRTRKVFGTDEELFRWSFSMKSYGIRIRWTPYGAEDENVFLAEEQPLPPVVSPTTESPGCVAKSDLEEDPEEYEDDESDPEDGPVDYPMERGDDGDDDEDDSFKDDANDGDEDEEDEEEQEEHLAPADFAASISLPPEAEVERLLAMPTPPPSLLTSLPPPFAG
ncbi:hypothetical protein Tco_0436261 [Tanacetum coccineum]